MDVRSSGTYYGDEIKGTSTVTSDFYSYFGMKKYTVTADTSDVKAKGIDISKHQGDVDWDKVQASGKVDFVMIRAGYGKESNQIDIQFEANYAACKKLGIPCGAYWYSYATTAAEAKQEAQIFLGAISGKSFEYPVAYDIEEEKCLKAADTIAAAFCEALENAGYYVMIYSFKSGLENSFSSTTKSAYDTWLAHVDVEKTDYSGNFGIWQYSWKGSVDGIAGDVDLDYAYKDYPSIMKKAGKNGFGTTESDDTTAFESYKVKVTVAALNIRKNPGTQYAVTGTIRDKGVYTIVEESTDSNGSKWGKLKSGKGWISLNYVTKA